jgi:aminobenzoyl-glutamate utilization protein B
MRTDKQIRESIDEKRQTYIDTAEFIWEHPEPIFKEYRSSERLREVIRAEGFRIQEQAAGLETAFVAEWGKGTPIIGFMGEFDALPGIR